MPFRRFLARLADLRDRETHQRSARRQRSEQVAPAESAQRVARYESYEDRLALSAEPLADLLLDPIQQDDLQGAPSQIVQSAQTSNDYGVDYVRRTYGFLGAGQTVAIIDSGIAYDHPALGGGLGASYRVVGGWDFAENDANPYDDAPGGFHGTHVAGIVGSSDANYRGVAPGVDLVGLRVFDDQGRGEIEWVEQALRWVHQNRNAFENPITTVNLSLGMEGNGGLPADARLEDELAQLKADGIVVVASAGNSFTKYNTPGLSYPAASPYVTPVASVGAGGALSDFSQRDSRVLAAPGERVTSTVPDYAKNLDGKTNDFERASGTSMATPFVAGASVLLREAMLFAGRSDITADVIYGHLRQTADQVFDPHTNSYYHRINVGRAVDAAMPADDYGSTVADAFALNVLDGDRTLSGLLGRTDDVDYFTFTAGETGVAHFRSQSDGAVVTEWRLVDGVAQDVAVSLEVIAGQTYTVGLATKAGIGRYEVSIRFEASVTAVDWGSISFREYANEAPTGGETWRTIQASREGTLTVEAFFNNAAGNIDLEVYDGQDRLVASSRSRGNQERIDLAATAGEVFSIKIVGANADVDFRLTNLVSVSAGVIDVGGTSGADTFAFSTGAQHVLHVNGVRYAFPAQEFSGIRFQGESGEDSLSLTGTSGDERFTARPGDVAFAGVAWSVTAVGVEIVDATGGGGRDEAMLLDSRGHDRLEASPTETRFVGDRFDHRATGFATVLVRASDGYDMAFLSDSTGNDTFTAGPDSASLVGAGYSMDLNGFDYVRAAATTGDDRAVLHDSAGAERYFARPGMAWMSGRDFLNFATGFDLVHAYATGGGFDMAWLFDSRHDDHLTAGSHEVILTGPGFQHSASGFETARVIASAGGHDRAEFFRATGDTFTTVRGEAIQSGSGFLNIANHFAQVDEHAQARIQQVVFDALDREEESDTRAIAIGLNDDRGACAVDILFEELG